MRSPRPPNLVDDSSIVNSIVQTRIQVSSIHEGPRVVCSDTQITADQTAFELTPATLSNPRVSRDVVGRQNGTPEVANISIEPVGHHANGGCSGLEVRFPVATDPFIFDDTAFNKNPGVLTDCPMDQILAPLLKTTSLKETYFVLPNDECGKTRVFIDRELPPRENEPVFNEDFPVSYFVKLHERVAAAGTTYPANTPNHLGARIPLRHCQLKVDRWRYHLVGYEGIDICQLIEYGFPLGLAEGAVSTLKSTYRNHGSSYQYYKWWDKMTVKGVMRTELAGPCQESPFVDIHISPLMTAHKRPRDRRCVFDATFGTDSLNNKTPDGFYMGQPMEYSYPRIEDFKQLVLSAGRGCHMWKRDLSRYFLQIPLCPSEYSLVAFVWRSCIYFFTGLMFGLKNSGYQGQRLTDAACWVHRRLGLQTDEEKMFNSLNYVDDFGGCESTASRATQSAVALENLLQDLGLEESKEKYHPPSTSMPYLGVLFDSVKMTMSVPPDKLQEIREELTLWARKSTATKRNLQQLLGKLFWVTRCVRFSRTFMCRLLLQLKIMNQHPENKKIKLTDECKLDIQWWNRFLRRFNGVELIYRDDPLLIDLEDALDLDVEVNCGDAQMWGGGSYYRDEYWSRPFPVWLRDPEIPIHIKEFYVVLASAWLWGDQWRGHLIYIYCDNDAVIDVLDKEKPKDEKMMSLLREFMYIVCIKGFTPTFRKVGTKENFVADHISRCHDAAITKGFFSKNNIIPKSEVEIPDNFFDLHSNW